VGQELAFYLTINPELYKQFAATLSSQKPHSTQFQTQAFTESSKPKNLDSLRETLLLHGVSEALKTKLGS